MTKPISHVGRKAGWSAREISREQMVPWIARETGMTYPAVRQVLDLFLSKTMETVASGKPVQLRRFGRLWLQQMNPKWMPPTPTRNYGVQLPARKKIRFTPAPKFVKMLDNPQIERQIDIKLPDATV